MRCHQNIGKWRRQQRKKRPATEEVVAEEAAAEEAEAEEAEADEAPAEDVAAEDVVTEEAADGGRSNYRIRNSRSSRSAIARGHPSQSTGWS